VCEGERGGGEGGGVGHGQVVGNLSPHKTDKQH
jgi:hypothetical protein